MSLDDLLKVVFQKGGSDLHISVGLPPIIRIDGKLIRTDHPPLTKEDVNGLIFSMLTNEQRRTLEQNWELDCSYGVQDIGRFRVNVYKERGSYGAALRSIPTQPPSFNELGLPSIIREVAERPRGLILVTGPTGSGKSTTLAAMIDFINSNKTEHIITIEDPIEYIHNSKRSVVHQRELGEDTRSFNNALRAALREDPDIILVGEMRDLETIQLALTAAETGHLVMGTLHTSSASQTVDRIVDVFSAEQQQQIRIQLSNSLIAVFSQTLIPKVQPDGQKKGRALAQEIMVVTPAIANLIREGKTAQIYSAIQTGGMHKMQTLESSLKELYQKNLITQEDAIAKTSRPEDFKRMIGGFAPTM
ncbi:MAG: twitching motility protein PilT [Candidatus Melainabacteria bacterium RIFOXYA12_FULL_32_12]|nr:MAG: twitching motility protein PilT [Candidatus Melainabacteria bacterium RIFOXYA2_FULL_32_9]OGI24284.1 MAG: twitching motility protein PilT [Candidatus Melainabacteria bacterium RIFOXYA12_FULL_32_12]